MPKFRKGRPEKGTLSILAIRSVLPGLKPCRRYCSFPPARLKPGWGVPKKGRPFEAGRLAPEGLPKNNLAFCCGLHVPLKHNRQTAIVCPA
jgi:hypothetical protein